MAVDIFAFSETQQEAILGQAIVRGEVFETLGKIKVSKEWWASASLSSFWGYIQEFKKGFKKYPVSWDELVDSIKDTDAVKASAKRIGDKCTKAAGLHQWEVLEQKLLGWAKSRVVLNSVNEIVQKYNDGKHEEAFDLFTEGSLELQKQDANLGLTQDSFISSAVRSLHTKEKRVAEASKILPYGISFLEDSLTGILPSDVLIIGAGPGIGKTEAAKILATHIAKEKQQPVHFFALEAFDGEIETRIQYGLMGNWYRDDHEHSPAGMISFKNYINNRLDNEFAPYEKRAQEVFERDYKHLHTYYACKGLVDQQGLENEIYKIKNETSCIVLDHIHYLDVGDQENLGMTRLMRGIKDMSQIMGIPFILVSHLKKKDGRFGKKLAPTLDDFHGTSNIGKIATKAVVFSRADEFISTDPRARGVPTFIRPVKVRVDGSAMYYTGVGFFDTYKSEYSPYYAIGHLSYNDDKWKPAFGNVPHWAKEDRLITNTSEVG